MARPKRRTIEAVKGNAVVRPQDGGQERAERTGDSTKPVSRRSRPHRDHLAAQSADEGSCSTTPHHTVSRGETAGVGFTVLAGPAEPQPTRGLSVQRRYAPSNACFLSLHCLCLRRHSELLGTGVVPQSEQQPPWAVERRHRKDCEAPDPTVLKRGFRLLQFSTPLNRRILTNRLKMAAAANGGRAATKINVDGSLIPP